MYVLEPNKSCRLAMVPRVTVVRAVLVAVFVGTVAVVVVVVVGHGAVMARLDRAVASAAPRRSLVAVFISLMRHSVVLGHRIDSLSASILRFLQPQDGQDCFHLQSSKAPIQ